MREGNNYFFVTSNDVITFKNERGFLVTDDDIIWFLRMGQVNEKIKMILQNQQKVITESVSNIFTEKLFPEFYSPLSNFVVGISCSISVIEKKVIYTFFIKEKNTQQNILYQQILLEKNGLSDFYDKWSFIDTKLEIEEELMKIRKKFLEIKENKKDISFFNFIKKKVLDLFYFLFKK